MFHPLLSDLSKIKDADLENTILDITKKYHIAIRLGQGGVAHQIIMALDVYRAEQSKRQQLSMQSTMKKQNKDLDDLINVT
jgi:hypothetical protein